MFCLIMGVAGSGKSTIGKLFSDRTGWKFYDADDFHSPENIAKMSEGIPLTDSDRELWLAKLKELISQNIDRGNHGILACSALKSTYRKFLTPEEHRNKIVWVYLYGNYDLILTRLKQRQGHFFKEEMLHSQFNNLEEPEEALKIDIALSSDAIVEMLLTYLTSIINIK